MALRKWFFDRAYRRGPPMWDTGITPPEVAELIEGPEPLPPGRALDLGCGTGTNVRYLAGHGFEVVGVDFSPMAIEASREKLANVPRTTVFEGDVTELSSLGIAGPFDFVLDVGCFHTIPRARRDAYAHEVGRVTGAGGVLLIWAFGRRFPGKLIGGGVTRDEMRRRFAPALELVRVLPGQWPKGAAWYTFRRRATAGSG